MKLRRLLMTAYLSARPGLWPSMNGNTDRRITMSRRHLTRRFSSFVVTAVAATLAIPGLAQTTTVVVKEPAPASRPSAAECSARAERAAIDSTGVAGGAVRGGVGGAAVGAIVGGGKGARSGAAAGAIVGGVAGGARRNDVYRRVYDDCMRGY